MASKPLELVLDEVRTLSNLNVINSLGKLYESTGDNPDSRLDWSKKASMFLTGGLKEDYLEHATSQHWAKQVETYKSAHKDEFEGACKILKPQLLNFYASHVDDLREKVKADIEKKIAEEKAKKPDMKVSDEEVRQIMSQAVHFNFAKTVSSLDFELNKDYIKSLGERKEKAEKDGREDKALDVEYKNFMELFEAYSDFKKFEKAKPEEKASLAGDYFINHLKLPRSSKAINDWSDQVSDVESIYGKILGKKLLTSDLHLDRANFEKLFGTMGSYAAIASLYLASKAKE